MDVMTGDAMPPAMEGLQACRQPHGWMHGWMDGLVLCVALRCVVCVGIWDNYRVKRQMIGLAPSLAQQLLLVDEVIKAGKQMRAQD